MKLKKIYTFVGALLFAHLATGQTPGTLDNGFGQQGVVETPIPHLNFRPCGVVQQADGKLVLAGQKTAMFGSLGGIYMSRITVSRYEISGARDTSFGTNGVLSDSIGPGSEHSVQAVRLQPDQKIVVGGYSTHNFSSEKGFIVRYLSTGARDSSFGHNGVVFIGSNIPTDYMLYDLALQADGKIIITDRDGQLMRYNMNGTLDSSFGVGGIVTINVLYPSIILQPDGKILAGGTVHKGASNYFAIARLLSNGVRDSSFNMDSGATAQALGTAYANINKLSFDANGKIVAVGKGWESPGSIAIARFNNDGTLDGTFYHHLISVGNNSNEGTDVITTSDGKIVVAGNSQDATTWESSALLIRLNGDGHEDSTFGTYGIVNTLLSKSLVIGGMAQQSDGKIVLSGVETIQGAINNYNVLLRYNNDASGPTSVALMQSSNSGISIYPNPTNNQLFIDMSQAQIKTDCRFELNDITGKVMASGTLKTGVNTINTSSLANGLYLLQIMNGAERIVSKVVKE